MVAIMSIFGLETIQQNVDGTLFSSSHSFAKIQISPVTRKTQNIFSVDQNQHYVPIYITETLNRSFIKVIKYYQGLNDPKISCQSNDHDLWCETERFHLIGLCGSDGLLQLTITIEERDITDTNLKFIGSQIIQLSIFTDLASTER